MSKYKWAVKAAEYILSSEAAQEQIKELLQYYDIDLSRITNPEQLAQAEAPMDGLAEAIRLGRVEIRRGKDEVLEVVHTLQNGQQVVYGEVGGPAKLAMDKHPREAYYARVYALMGSLAGVGSEGILKYRPRDRNIAELLGALFMNA